MKVTFVSSSYIYKKLEQIIFYTNYNKSNISTLLFKNGSVDKYRVDNKFITVKICIWKQRALNYVFRWKKKADTRGAEGLLDSVILRFKDIGIENLAKEKLVGLTTDGENANTGKSSGLWVRMKEYLQRDIFLCLVCCPSYWSSIEWLAVNHVRGKNLEKRSQASFYFLSSIFHPISSIGKNWRRK